MHINDLPTPALILDLDILERNLSRMQEKAISHNVALRPHIKTHKCLEVGRKQVNLGAKGITVSTLYEAQQFANVGFNDIIWAFPLPLVYIPRALSLAKKIQLGLVVDSLEAIDTLEVASMKSNSSINVWLEVDCGSQRGGVDPHSIIAEQLLGMLEESKSLVFKGILTHAGHSYNAKSREEIIPIAEQERTVMVRFAEKMREKGYSIPAISIGSTPTMSVTKNLKGIDEIRPGNYAFYDYTQAMIGSCDVNDCALTVMAMVVSHQPGATYFIIDAGALALSKDLGPTHVSNDMDMGVIFEDYERKRLHSHIHLRTLSQEHGKVVADDRKHIENKFRVGDRVRILEHHACLTAAQFDKYYVVREDTVVDEWKILRGRI